MDTFEAIYQRRAVKHYDPTHEFTDAEVTKLLEATLQSPTSYNIQHWRFVVVRDKALREQLREAAYGQAQVTDASLLVVLTGDIKAWEKSPERYWKNAPPEIAEFVVQSLVGFYQGREWLQRDEAMRSVGMAGQTLMLAAKSMGYDSCPMIGFDIDKVGELINLPADHAVGFMVAIGKATEPARAKGGQLPLDEVVIQDRFA